MSKQYDCKVCGEVFSPKLEEELIEHLRDHYTLASEEADRAADQLEDLGSHPEL